MNRYSGIGRLVADPNVRQSEGGLSVARYTVAIDRRSKNGEKEADFIPCVTFGKTAEFVGRNLVKGSQVGISGHLQSGSYVDKDGKRVYTLNVVVEDHELVGGRPGGARAATSEQGPAPATTTPDFMSVPEGVGGAGLPFE